MCIENAITRGDLQPYDSTEDRQSTRQEAGGGLVAYFMIFYFLFYAAGWTSTMIPYDALGMELTDDFGRRSTLFGCRSFFQMLGYLVQVALGLVMDSVFSGDIKTQIGVQSWPIAAIGISGIIAITCKVKEREGKVLNESGEGEWPIVPQIITVLQNTPYLVYICMKIPLTWASMFPSLWLIDYLKYAQTLESWNADQYIVLAVVLVSSFFWIPVLVWGSKRFGRRQTIMAVCLVSGTVMFIAFLIPPDVMPKPLMYFLGVIIALGQVGNMVVPDAILGDIIDYGEMQTGKRSEGLYCVLETNAQQLVEIVGGVVPILLLGALNFRNNGGCNCGCGTKCEHLGSGSHPYLRWDCPGDIGYACGSDFGARPLFGATERVPPCTQQPPSVVWIIRIMIFAAPGVCFFLVGFIARYLVIDRTIHSQILEAVQKADSGEKSVDPVTLREVRRTPLPDDPTARRLLSFTAFERSIALRRGLGAMRAKVGAQLGLWLALLVTAIVCMLVPYADDENLARVVTLASLLCGALVVLVPWDGARLRSALELDSISVAQKLALLGPGSGAGGQVVVIGSPNA